ncbi:MAG: helix-turn-helix domain-containing protein [Sporolactobacillus sp.]
MDNSKTINKFNDEIRQIIVEPHRSGTSDKDLSSEYGVFEQTAYKWIKKFNSVPLEDGKFFTPENYVNIQKYKTHSRGKRNIKKAMPYSQKSNTR